MNKRQQRIEKNKAIWSGIGWDEVAAFIGPNADAYKPTWEKNHADIMKQGYPGFGFSWSWPAFIPILGIPWAAARRQWTFVAIMVGAVVVMNLIMLFSKNTSFGFMAFLVPMMAKNFYVQTAVNKIAKIKQSVADDAARMTAIREAGGLRMVWGYAAGAACLGLIALSVVAMIMFG